MSRVRVWGPTRTRAARAHNIFTETHSPIDFTLNSITNRKCPHILLSCLSSAVSFLSIFFSPYYLVVQQKSKFVLAHHFSWKSYHKLHVINSFYVENFSLHSLNLVDVDVFVERGEKKLSKFPSSRITAHNTWCEMVG